jgi:hypothetical protein
MKAYSVGSSMLLVLLLVLGGVAPLGYAQESMANQTTLPILKYDPPPGFIEASYGNFEDFSSREVNGSIQIYPFRPFTGNLQTAWQQTLLRGWIDPMHEEASVAGQPVFKSVKLEGAQAVSIVQFVESNTSLNKPHMRTLIVANAAAAIIDVSAANNYCWQRMMPGVDALFKSVSMGTDVADVPPTGGSAVGSAAGSGFSGIFMGFKPKYTVNLNGPVWSGTSPPAPFFYIFSPDGRAYRTFDATKVPRGGPETFDYRSAASVDPLNSGQYSVRGNQIVMRFGRGSETVTGAMTSKDAFVIYGVTYSRQ